MKQYFSILLCMLLIVVACGRNNDSEDNGPEPNPNPNPSDSTGIDTSLQNGFQRVRFQVSNEIIRNPERGFYSHLEWSNASGSPMSNATLASLKDQHLSLVLNIYYMKNYVDKSLDQALLTLIENNMKALRNNGFKVVLRFAYSSSSSVEKLDAPLELATEHLRQLTPILQEYADVIAVMEAGFVGAWGEWYYTNNYGMGAFFNKQKRGALVDSMLKALPPERMICMRTPNYKLKLLGITVADTLTRSEAYQQTKKARLAYHNDCFLASASDQGTFSGESDRNYNKADSRYLAMGGETCAPSDYSGCVNALIQMRDYHWSYLNKDYQGTVLGSWTTQGCMDDVKRKLGYRFELHYADKQTAVQKGANYQIRCLIKNSGFAAPYNPRDVFVLLLNSSGTEVQRTKQSNDPRFWFGDTFNIVDLNLSIPSSLAAGKYKVALYLPDPKPTIAAIPDYAIRLANNNTWSEDKGYNSLFEIDVP